jgi:hypothetical protein
MNLYSVLYLIGSTTYRISDAIGVGTELALSWFPPHARRFSSSQAFPIQHPIIGGTSPLQLLDNSPPI